MQGYLRRATALEGLEQWFVAINTYEKLLELTPKDSVDAKSVRSRMKSAQAKAQDTRPAVAVAKGFLQSANKSKGIYDEKEDVIKQVTQPDGSTRWEDENERSWRHMLQRLLAACNNTGTNANGERVVLDDGVFAKLLQEHEFQKLVYPGIPPDQLKHAPKNLQELLQDPIYEDELLELMPKVQAKAESVLGNVKKRAAAQGDFMDTATERVLLPQVLQEAFAREVLAMVHRVNTKKHALLASHTSTIADPNAECATWDQLPDEFIDELFQSHPAAGKVGGVAVLDEFLGDEWVEILLNDVQRMANNGLLLETVTNVDAQMLHRPGTVGASSPNGRMRFVELEECQREFPALAELMEKLHALPYEINRKRPQQATLCAQFAHSTAVQQLAPGEAQRLRLDCGAGDKDNGFKLSCVYCFNAPTHEDTTLNLRSDISTNAVVQRIAPAADRLIVFKSQSVLNEITTVRGDDSLYYLTFWIHGKELLS